MVNDKDMLTDYEEQIYELQNQNKKLNEKLLISDLTVRDLKDKNNLIQSQISDVEAKYMAMRESYDNTITTLKTKMSLTKESTPQLVEVSGTTININQSDKGSDYKELFQDAQQEMENIFLSIERLKDANSRLAEENDELNGFLKNQYVRKSIENMRIDTVISEVDDARKENLFDSIKKYLSKN